MVREWRLHVLSIFSLAVAFVCLGAALLVVTNLRAVEQRWAHAGRASVYLKDGATQDEVDSLRLALTRVPGVTAVRYVSSGDARSEFGQTQLPTPGDTGAARGRWRRSPRRSRSTWRRTCPTPSWPTWSRR
jgi:cell division protein FtsX